MSPEEKEWHAEADRVLTAALADSGTQDGGEAAEWLVSLALNCEEREYVERWCLRVGRGLPSGHHLLGLSALCVGHLARRFGRVSDEARALVEDLAERACRSPTDVDGRAMDGAEDVVRFAPRLGRAHPDRQ